MSMSVRLARSAFTSATPSNTFSRLDCEHIFLINFYRCPLNQNSYYLIYFQKVQHSFLVKLRVPELMKNDEGTVADVGPSNAVAEVQGCAFFHLEVTGLWFLLINREVTFPRTRSR